MENLFVLKWREFGERRL